MANNQYVNQVGLADGTVLIDLTTDTAEQADVLSGKYFHLKTGQRVPAPMTATPRTQTLPPAKSCTVRPPM